MKNLLSLAIVSGLLAHVSGNEQHKRQEPAIGERRCHPTGDHRDVSLAAQSRWAQTGCIWFALGKSIKPGDRDVTWYAENTHFSISWNEGCTWANEQLLYNPVDGESATCYSLMTDNYQNCNNGGAGGYIDAGCLRYDFWAT